jgi:acyl-CoA hydrolase
MAADASALGAAQFLQHWSLQNRSSYPPSNTDRFALHIQKRPLHLLRRLCPPRPCKLGDVVMIAAMVNRTFSSSMEVGVRVEAEEMSTGLRRHCCSAYLTFVSLKAKQQAKLPLPPPLLQPQDPQQQGSGAQEAQQQQQQQQQHALSRVVPHTSEQQRIYAQAESRRQQRLAARQAAKDDPHKAALLKACRLRPVTHRCADTPAQTSGWQCSAAAGREKASLPGGSLELMGTICYRSTVWTVLCCSRWCTSATKGIVPPQPLVHVIERSRRLAAVHMQQQTQPCRLCSSGQRMHHRVDGSDG